MASSASSELEGTPAAVMERRAADRQTCKLEVCYGSAPAGRPAVIAVVRDLSASGVGLMVNEPIPRGAIVTVRLCSETGGIVFSKSLRIKYARNETAGSWSIGGSFEKPLTKKEMKLLLQEAAEV